MGWPIVIWKMQKKVELKNKFICHLSTILSFPLSSLFLERWHHMTHHHNIVDKTSKPQLYFHTSCMRTARLRAWAFAGCLCGKYHNLMSWLKSASAFTQSDQSSLPVWRSSESGATHRALNKHWSDHRCTGKSELAGNVWARSWENLSYAIWEQQRHRSACASTVWSVPLLFPVHIV